MGPDEAMGILSSTHQGQAHQRRLFQIEPLAPILLQEAPQPSRLLSRRKPAPVLVQKR